MLISSKKYDTESIEGNLYCRTSLHGFILIGLFSLSYMNNFRIPMDTMGAQFVKCRESE